MEPPPSPDGTARRWTVRSEAGQGLIPTVAGFGVVLLLLLLATQVTFDLYARSAVTAASVDAARAVADERQSAAYGTNPDAAMLAVQQAQDRAGRALGAYGRVTSFRWNLLPTAADPSEVELRAHFDLRGTRYSLVGPLALPGLNQFDRTVRVRVERLVCRPDQACKAVSR
ncbi:MAG: hypothetical protein NVS3B21_06790 [Acidimicrobiales bacterium]